MKNELCRCGQPRNHWHHDRDKVIGLIRKSPYMQPIDQDADVQVWSIPYEALLPHPNIEKYLDENPVGGQWRNLADYDEPPYWHWEPPHRASHLAENCVITSLEIFQHKGLAEKIIADKEANTMIALFKKLDESEGYQGKTQEELDVQDAEFERRYKAGPPREEGAE